MRSRGSLSMGMSLALPRLHCLWPELGLAKKMNALSSSCLAFSSRSLDFAHRIFYIVALEMLEWLCEPREATHLASDLQRRIS